MRGFFAWQRLPRRLTKKEDCQDREDNVERCQCKTVKTCSIDVGIGFGFPLIAARLRHARRINVLDVRKRMRCLKDRDERKRQYQD
ncbi:MAG: hypothetical protein M3Q16_11980 [Pseudomonadota bacterium]|nr:hypothetical protein [Pseudomonadota bacterium]